MKERKLHLFILAAIVLLILWYAKRRAGNAVVVTTDQSPSNGGLGINDGTTAGMPPENWYYGKGGPLVITPGDINVNLNVNPWSSLADKYIPLFGFVGIATGPGAYQ